MKATNSFYYVLGNQEIYDVYLPGINTQLQWVRIKRLAQKWIPMKLQWKIWTSGHLWSWYYWSAAKPNMGIPWLNLVKFESCLCIQKKNERWYGIIKRAHQEESMHHQNSSWRIFWRFHLEFIVLDPEGWINKLERIEIPLARGVHCTKKENACLEIIIFSPKVGYPDMLPACQ